MDHDSSMFSFDQIEELLEFSSPFQQQINQQNDHLVIPPLQNTGSSEPVDSQKQDSSVAFDNVDDNSKNHQKKVTHRDIERQRRQEMASLHRSLRSLLPIERLKGKRAIADHIHETVGYIRQLEKSIDKLTETRDKLKQLLNPSSFSDASRYLPRNSQTSVTVKISLAGLEVVVNSAFIGGVNLSRVLKILIAEGLSITSSISTKVDGRLLHKIETQVKEGRNIDSAELQQKLTDYCNGNWQTNNDP